MASGSSLQYAAYIANPQTFKREIWNTKLVGFEAKVLFNAQAAADDDKLFVLPIGFRFLFGMLTATATLGGAATIAIGITGTTGKYRTAAIHTTANLPVLFGNAAARNAVLTAEETIRATYAAAALPSNAGGDYYEVGMYGVMMPATDA